MELLSQEDLQALVETQGEQLESQAQQMESLKQQFEELKNNAGTRALATSIETKSKTDTPKMPEKNVTRTDKEGNKKEYKWNAAAFHLKGFGKVNAEDAALDDKIIDAILAVKGQRILIEQA